MESFHSLARNLTDPAIEHSSNKLPAVVTTLILAKSVPLRSRNYGVNRFD